MFKLVASRHNQPSKSTEKLQTTDFCCPKYALKSLKTRANDKCVYTHKLSMSGDAGNHGDINNKQTNVTAHDLSRQCCYWKLSTNADGLSVWDTPTQLSPMTPNEDRWLVCT